MSQASATTNLASLAPLRDWLADHASNQADHLALSLGEQQVSYQQLLADCDCCLAVLCALGVQRGQVVGLLALNGLEFITLLVACDQLGAVFMPLNWRLAAAEIDAQLQDAQAKICFFDQTNAGLANQTKHHHNAAKWYPIENLNSEQTTSTIAGSTDSDLPLLLVYTSGSTGKPKGALHGRRQLISNAQASWQAHDMVKSDRILSALPFFHVGGLCIQTLPALLLGASVYVQPRFDPQAFLVSIDNHRITVALLVPPVMKSLLEHPLWNDTRFNSVRIMMAGSSIVPVELLAAFHQKGVVVGQVYGATETGPVTVVLSREQAIDYAGWCGWPALNVSIKLTQEVEGVGELWVKAPNVMLGYIHAKPLSEMTDGWHATGDLATIDDQGCIKVVGRCRDLIISGGENIHPAEIESQLMQIPGIQDCAVLGVPDPHWGEVVVACVVLVKKTAQFQAPNLPSAEQLNAQLATKIARFKLPRRYVWLDRLPKSALGKVLKEPLLALIHASE